VSIELVVARYEEDLSWVTDVYEDSIRFGRMFEVTVYNKGPSPLAVDTRARVITLPNVGREAHTYLIHLLSRWDTLADWTGFLQGDPFPHMLGLSIVKGLLQPSCIPFFPGFTHCREWLPSGYLNWPNINRVYSYPKDMRPAGLSFLAWFREKLGIELRDAWEIRYAPGACFAASREMIKRRPRSLYEGLLEDLADHPHPEEAHYCERAWSPLMGEHCVLYHANEAPHAERVGV
jgi:hypothetical protein